MISELFKSKLKEKRSRDLLSSSHPTPTLTPLGLRGSVEHSLESGSRLLYHMSAWVRGPQLSRACTDSSMAIVHYLVISRNLQLKTTLPIRV